MKRTTLIATVAALALAGSLAHAQQSAPRPVRSCDVGPPPTPSNPCIRDRGITAMQAELEATRRQLRDEAQRRHGQMRSE